MTKNFNFDSNVNKIALEATTDKEVLLKLSSLLHRHGYVKESYCNAIIEREKIFPTGLNFNKYGVALPHTDCCHVNKPMIAICTLKNPVIFKSMGDSNQNVSVNIIFMLAMNNSDNQLQLLSTLIENLQNQDLMSNLLRAQAPSTLTRLISNNIIL